MESVRDSWTDERLDDLNRGIADFRNETKGEFASVKNEFALWRNEFAAVRREMKDEFAAVRAEMKAGFEGLHRTMIQFQGLMIAALIGLIATQI